MLTAPHRAALRLRAPVLLLLSLACAIVLASLAPCVAAAGGATEGSAAAVVAEAASTGSVGVYTIAGSIHLPRTVTTSNGGKFVNARVLLNGGERSCVVRADGSFSLFPVVAGRSYTVDVVMPEFQFPTVRVDVSNKVGQKGKMKAVTAVSQQKLNFPLQLRPAARSEYFQKREPVNVLGMFKNPMVIMMLVTVFMVVVMPRMMGGMDPAELNEMKKMQANLSMDGLRKTLEAKAAELK